MDDLPELPFEQILSQLSLEDRLKSRTVSRRWRKRFDSYPVKSLCCSECPIGFILGKSRWFSDAFAQNFICSPRFKWFFDTFGRSTLSNLKHLRLYGYDLDEENGTAFAATLNSFGRLEQLDMIHFSLYGGGFRSNDFELNLPMLSSIRLEHVYRVQQLILDAPRLQKVKLVDCSPRLDFVHGESVERVLADKLEYIPAIKLKNLQYLYMKEYINEESRRTIGPTFLSSLEQLKEIHLNDQDDVRKLFEQKRRYGRVDLKIYLRGWLLNGPADPAIVLLLGFKEEVFALLAENPTRLADEIPFWETLPYKAIECVDPEAAINVLKRFTDLEHIYVDAQDQKTQRFLDLLKVLKLDM